MSHPLFNANVRVALLCLLAYSAYAQETQPNDAEETSGAAPVAKRLPSALDNYRIKKETLLAADAKDNNQVGTSDAAKAAAKALGADKGKNELPIEVELKPVEVRAKRFYEVGPLPGLGLTKEEIPGNVQSISAKEIKESHSLSLTDLMNSKLQSVNVNDYQSNPFQMDVTYRGFTASPQLGTSQGISVFMDGIRINEPFGDVVNWDMIPMNALAGIDMFPGSNPLFGLGTLGGALAMRTKSGFDNPGVDAEVLTGSFGRKQLQMSGGWNNGVVAAFVSGNFFLEDGWRNNSPSRVNQVFGKFEWMNESVRLGLSTLYAGNKLTGNGLLPQQMADQNPSQVYTSPDESKNNLFQFQLTGQWDVSDTFNITGQIYHRNSKRKTKTTDVNEDFAGQVTSKAAGKQVLQGYSDINNDGLPDYNTFAVNVAAGADGRALDVNGIAYGDAGFDINNLAIGTAFGTKAVTNQAMITPNDGSSTPVPRWTMDPRVSDASAQYDTVTPATVSGLGQFNNALPDEYYQFALNLWKNKVATQLVNGSLKSGGTFAGTDEFGSVVDSQYYYNADVQFSIVDFAYYVDSNGFLNKLTTLNPVNDALRDAGYAICGNVRRQLCQLDSNGAYINRDGASANSVTGATGVGTGYIDGTPTALITQTQIDQIGDGGALQFNWNLDQHKFMVGASVDKADAKYASSQYLGFLDASRNGYVAPELLGYEYYARDAAHAVSMNDFKGNSITSSLYSSETWSPTKNLNITAAARYNYTTIKNTLAVSNSSKFSEVSVASFLNILDTMTLCKGTDSDGDGLVDGALCPTGIDNNILEYSPELLFDLGILEPGPTEKFKYHSLNPSLGATWQANEALNVYSNWSRGARTPTVIELGCAYDDTLVPLDGTSPVIYQERSLADRRSCNLPSTMSGDPYLKQVRSETFEMGARGYLNSDLQWNASVYRTDLQDDIYFVSASPTLSFFQNIGDTRRQGLEMGLKGKWGKASFGINYSLTDATFQSGFTLDSPYNSQAGANETDFVESIVDGKLVRTSNYGKINVKPGNRMPGIPLHNINFNMSYPVTDRWTVGLTAVMHSSAFVRGNENNEHTAGAATPLHLADCGVTNAAGGTDCYVARADWGSGKTAGYTVFNFQTSYKLDKGLSLGLLINNIFDTRYTSAGRLGLNAFSPATNGVVGASGFNYNSSEWQGTSFVSTGAPRGAWLTLTYEFDPSAK